MRVKHSNFINFHKGPHPDFKFATSHAKDLLPLDQRLVLTIVNFLCGRLSKPYGILPLLKSLRSRPLLEVKSNKVLACKIKIETYLYD
jgi:hypothetical protein